MRKMRFILGIFLVLLAVSACTPRQAAPKTAKSTAAQQGAGADSAPAAPSTQTGAQQQPSTPAEQPATQPQPSTSSVTKDDLDRLKAGVEGLQPEDLGGISSG